MAMKPWLPYRRNPIQNASTQAKEGPMNKKVDNAKTSTSASTRNTIRGAITQRNGK